MPFRKGHKYGGKKDPPGGRPTKEAIAARQYAESKARAKLEAATDSVMDKYLKFAKKDPATTRHAVDKLIPPESKTTIDDGGPVAVSVTIENSK